MIEDYNTNGKLIIRATRTHKERYIDRKTGQGLLKLRKSMIFDNLNLNIKPGTKMVLFSYNTKLTLDFIYTILGENIINKGSLRLRGKCLFTDFNRPDFLIKHTYRENILMGSKFIQERYSRVISELKIKLSNFDGGDMLEILEEAQNLSNTQKR